MSYRDAVFAKCRECIYDPLQVGTWRQQVGECASANCALHALRPRPIRASARDCPETR